MHTDQESHCAYDVPLIYSWFVSYFYICGIHILIFIVYLQRSEFVDVIHSKKSELATNRIRMCIVFCTDNNMYGPFL